MSKDSSGESQILTAQVKPRRRQSLDAKNFTTGDFLETYNNAKLDKGIKRLGERRVLDIINELETVGLISTWNVSRGRKGYIKEIIFNREPHIILDCYSLLKTYTAHPIVSLPPWR